MKRTAFGELPRTAQSSGLDRKFGVQRLEPKQSLECLSTQFHFGLSTHSVYHTGRSTHKSPTINQPQRSFNLDSNFWKFQFGASKQKRFCWKVGKFKGEFCPANDEKDALEKNKKQQQRFLQTLECCLRQCDKNADRFIKAARSNLTKVFKIDKFFKNTQHLAGSLENEPRASCASLRSSSNPNHYWLSPESALWSLQQDLAGARASIFCRFLGLFL